MKKLTKKVIKSVIPTSFFDGSKLNGVSLVTNSYDLFCKIRYKEYILRTTYDNPLIEILKEYFNVKHNGHWWGHYDEFIITHKIF